MRDEAEKRIGHLYPKVKAWKEPKTGRHYGEDDVKEWQRSEERGERNERLAEEAQICGYSTTSYFLSALSFRELTVIAWIWARTVKSPNPAFADVDVPLASTFMLSTKQGKEAYVQPEIGTTDEHGWTPMAGGKEYRFTVKVGKPKDAEKAKNGTKLSRGANFECIMSGTPISGDYIKSEGRAGRMSARLMAVVCEGDRGRVYVPPTAEHEAAADSAKPEWKPETPLAPDPRALWTPPYGLKTFGDLFTPRQLVALTTFSDLVQEAREKVRADAEEARKEWREVSSESEMASGESRNTHSSLRSTHSSPPDFPLDQGGDGPAAYADAVAVYLGLGIGRQANRTATLNFWDTRGENVQQVFARQALPMTWDFVEGNPLSASTGNFVGQISCVTRVMNATLPARPIGVVRQSDAQSQVESTDKVVSTDPPYYDNIGYADLSDFWLFFRFEPSS
jgi:putative DNA methylase